MAAPTVRSASSASNTAGSLAVTKPSGLASGDLLVAWHLADNDGALASMGGPSGWSLLGSDAGTSGGHPYEKVWTRVATSSDVSASSFTFTNSAAGVFNSVVIVAITAGTFDSTTPTTSVTFNNGGTSSSSSHVAPSVTGVVDGLLCTSHGTDSGGTAATYTPPSGMTERADTNSGSGSFTALEVNTLVLSATAATGAKTATCTTSRPWKGSTLIVNPVTVVVPPPSSTPQAADSASVSAVFSIAASSPGPAPWNQPVAVSDVFSIAATTPNSGLADSARIRDGFLISSLEWDPGKGRNRVSAFTFDANVVSARVSRRRVRGGVWELVRGGEIDVFNGRMLRPADDYEFPSGVELDYRIEGISTTGAVLQSATVRRQSVADSVWLKFITQPALNQQLEFMGRTEISRQSRTAVFDVQGRSDPVVVSDVHSSRRFSIRCKAETPALAVQLDHALSQGLPCYLQVPETLNTPSVYAVIGDYSHEAPATKSLRNVFTIPLIEVAAPPASIVSPGETWANLLTEYATWETLMASVPTWLDTAD